LSGRRACIVHIYTQSGLPNTEAFARILIMADAAERAGAREVYLILAQNIFDRQDIDPREREHEEYKSFSPGRKRKIEVMQGQSFSLDVAAKHFQRAGIKKILTLDTHSRASDVRYEKRFHSPDAFSSLDPTLIFAHYMENLGLEIGDKGSNLVLVAPDKNARSIVDSFYELSGFENAARVYCNKYRAKPNDPSKVEAAVEETSDNYNGIDGRIVIAMDDMGDTLGTLEKTVVSGLMEQGRPKQIHALLTHLILSRQSGYELIARNKLNVHGSNSHANMAFKKDQPGTDQISVLDFTPYFAWALTEHLTNGTAIPRFGIEDLSKAADLYEIAKKGRIIDFS
ncbi:ribose-phosphate pyrophosphokinase, partial [Candidatus Woesearchaeota archaeon]|nr:ribose-phosphate pyrophosphokinase [Candidatus Woesearchaeota archaeon]